MSDDAPSVQFTPPRRRWLQFSLRGFIVLMALAAVLMGWWSYWHHRIRKQRTALEEIASLQGRLTKRTNLWINRPIISSVNRTPWWLRADGEKTIPVTTGVSFDLLSYDDGFPEKSGLRDRDLRMLAVFPYLYEVSVPRSEVGDDGLAWVKPLRRLRRLDLSQTPVQDDDLAALAGLRELQSLTLDGVQLRGEGLAYLAGCRNLQSLVLTDVPLTIDGAKHLNGLSSLKELNLQSQDLSQLNLHDLPELLELSIHLTDDEADVRLANLPKLHNLNIVLENSFAPRRLWLDDLPALNRLTLQLWNEPEASSNEFSLQLRRLPSLEHLQLSGGRLPEGSLREVSQLPNLSYLYLDCKAGVDEAAVEIIRPMPNLLHLDLGTSAVSDDGLRAISNISTLRALMVSSSGTNTGMEALTALPNLRELHLADAIGEVDPARTFAKMKGLQHLSLTNCRFPALDLDGESDQTGLQRLTTLFIEECELGAVEIRRLPALQHLNLSVPQTRELHIDDLPQLRRLHVSLAAGQQVKRFTLNALPEMVWLDIQCGPEGAQVPADIFEHLLEFPKLQGGNVWGLDLPKEAKLQLQRLSAQKGVSL